MKRSRHFLLATVISVLVPIAAYAQLTGFGSDGLEFNTPGGGARAAGMGGAGLALAEGEMAFSWNPAAMAYTDKTKFGIDLLSRADKFQSSYIDYRWQLRNPNIQSYELDLSHFSVNYGGFSAPFSLEGDSDARFLLVPVLPLTIIPMLFSPSEELQLTVGGGYRHLFDLESKSEFDSWDSSRNSFKQNRGLDAISLSAAGKIAEGIGFGWNMNIYVRNTETNTFLGNDIMLLNFVNPTRTDTTIVDYWQKEKSTFSGFNMDLGLSANYDMFKAGFVFHTPLTINQDVILTRYVVVPPEPGGNIDRVNYKYSMPFGASFGIALTPIENLAIAFDFDYRPMSETDVSTDWEQLEWDSLGGTVNAEWEDVSQFRIGAEYKINAGFANIPLRAGFRNEPSVGLELLTDHWTYLVEDSAFVSISSDSTYGSQISTSIISFGSGLEFEKIWFNIGYQFGSSSYERNILYDRLDITPDPDVRENLFDVTHEIKRDYSKLFFSVGMYF